MENTFFLFSKDAICTLSMENKMNWWRLSWHFFVRCRFSVYSPCFIVTSVYIKLTHVNTHTEPHYACMLIYSYISILDRKTDILPHPKKSMKKLSYSRTCVHCQTVTGFIRLYPAPIAPRRPAVPNARRLRRSFSSACIFKYACKQMCMVCIYMYMT